MELYQRIRQRREELKMSQEELAIKVGYTSRSTIAKIESGTNDMPQSKIKAFADALKVSPSWLMGFDRPGIQNTSEEYNETVDAKQIKQDIEIFEKTDGAPNPKEIDIIEIIKEKKTIYDSSEELKQHKITKNNLEGLGDEEIITLAAHRSGHEGALSEEDMERVKLAIQIALAKNKK